MQMWNHVSAAQCHTFGGFFCWALKSASYSAASSVTCPAASVLKDVHVMG
jgi:hypothetical protein